MLPGTIRLNQDETHRLVSARYSETAGSALARLGNDQLYLRDLLEVEGATDEQLLGEANLLPGITVHELVFGVSYWQVVNAAFTHARPRGSRFNGSGRGAWYAGIELDTAQAEVAFHFTEGLREVNWREPETASYREYRADFRAEFHDIRSDARFAECLAHDSHAASQHLAAQLLTQGSAGVVYPSVRHAGGTCIACFRPALVTNVRKGWLVTFIFPNAFENPIISVDMA